MMEPNCMIVLYLTHIGWRELPLGQIRLRGRMCRLGWVHVTLYLKKLTSRNIEKDSLLRR